MKSLRHIERIAVDNEDSLRTLIRAITRSQGYFSLILARCNDATVREGIMQQLRNQCPVRIRELALKRSDKTLYTTISDALGLEQPNALMVSSLESVSALDQVLIATNQVREEFRNFSCPFVLWITDEILQKLIRLVPDFESWATSVEFARVASEPQDYSELKQAA
jgi:hypothetical protein